MNDGPRGSATFNGPPASRGPWITTASGRVVDYVTPDPASIALTDIAARLAKESRFAGATGPFYSVAQHSVLVADNLPYDDDGGAILKLYGLLHDAHEAWMKDIPTPMKHGVTQLGGGRVLEIMAGRFDAAIHAALGLPWPRPFPAIDRAVALADRIAYATELRDLFPDRPGEVPYDRDGPPPAPVPVRALAWPKAEEKFLRRARELAARAGVTGPGWGK